MIGTEACTFPVLTPLEAVKLESSTSLIPSPHPNLSRTPAIALDRSLSAQPLGWKRAGEDTEMILDGLGLSADQKRQLQLDGALGKLESLKTRL